MYLCGLDMRNCLKNIWFPILLLGTGAFQSFGIDAGRALDSGMPYYRILSGWKDTTQNDIPVYPVQDSTVKNDAGISEYTISDDSRNAVSDDTLYFGNGRQAGVAGYVIQGGDGQDSIIHQNGIADTTIMAADTITVPDSLKETDPLRYKYFIALKDSVTRFHIRESLISAGDSLELHLLDSLYSKDSTDIARKEFETWYNSMSRREKKKYRYEQELPKQLAKMDSLMHRKDSIRAVKDSIIESTPRILETYAVPDSMQYKRLIMWDHDRNFNNIRLQTQDTSYNYHFNDYPFFKEDVNATYLGVSGSPVQTFDFFKREEDRDASFYSPYLTYNYTPENLPMYNTKTPYTELAYWGTLFANTEKEESEIKVLTTQNILPELNILLEYHRYGGNGMLKNEDTDNRTFVAAANYMGKRYLMHAGYIYNKIEKSENGGIVDNFWIRDTTVDAREIDVHLSDASNKIKKNTVFLDQSYRIPFDFIKNIGKKKAIKREQFVRDSIMATGDSLAIQALLEKEASMEDGQELPDTMDTDVTTAFIGHCSEYSVFTKLYTDNITDDFGKDFYNNTFYLNPTSSSDSMRVMRFDNRLFLRLQPWSDDGIVSKLDVGIGNKLLNYYDFQENSYLSKQRNTVLNSTYLYAGAQGQFKKYLSWDATGKYNFLGHEINDFGVQGNISFSTYPFRKERNSPITLAAHFETNLTEPDHYQQRILTNHYKWEYDFGKISDTRIEASLSIPRWKLGASFGYALLNNNIYYDTLGIVRQNTKPMSVMTASLMKNFKVWNFHFDHRALFQLSSDTEVMPLPTLALNLRYYFQFNVVKNVMQMQIGANAIYNTKWYAPAYNPVLGDFHNQVEEKYGNCPDIDVFVNIQWKRACIFVKLVNVGMGWPNDSADYFSAHHYIRPQRAFKFGIFWPFYVLPNRNASVGGTLSANSGKASSPSR